MSAVWEIVLYSERRLVINPATGLIFGESQINKGCLFSVERPSGRTNYHCIAWNEL